LGWFGRADGDGGSGNHAAKGASGRSGLARAWVGKEQPRQLHVTGRALPASVRAREEGREGKGREGKERGSAHGMLPRRHRRQDGVGIDD